MEFFRVYGRVIGLLRAEKGLAITLAMPMGRTCTTGQEKHIDPTARLVY